MKNLKNLLVALCAALLIFTTSCDKREDSTPVTLLTKITQTQSDGTEYVRTLEYDSHNRLVKLKESYDTTVYEGLVTYNAEGKMSQYIVLQNGNESYKITYTWDATTATELFYWDKNESNNWVESTQKNIYDLNSDDQITKQQTFFKQDTSWVSNGYELLTWTNGNLEKNESWNVEKRKSSAFNPLNNLHGIEMLSSGLKTAYDSKNATALYEYDNKNNAYLDMGFVMGTIGSNKNNVTKVTYSFEGQDDLIFNIAYEYNDKNYPSKRTTLYTNPDNGEIDSSSLFYEYTTK